MKSKYIALTSIYIALTNKYIALVPASYFSGETNNPNLILTLKTLNPKDT